MKINILLLILLLTFSCKPNRQEGDQKIKTNNEDVLIEANKILVQKDVELIESYINRRNWNLKLHDSGLWYVVLGERKSDLFKKGDQINISYKLSLLDGTILKEVPKDQPGKIIIDQTEVESGLQIGLKFMGVGNTAKFILPPHLAHGLMGDQKNIPPRSIILYEIDYVEYAK